MSSTATYHIKTGYEVNDLDKINAISYVDSVENSESFQTDVYEYAAKVVRERGLKRVVDIGCGYGTKLGWLDAAVGDAAGKRVCGIDGSEKNIEHCQTHPYGEWFLDDFDEPKLTFAEPFELIISADVIEHVFDPDSLLNYVRRLANENTLFVISTPERDVVRGKDHNGPPPGHHIREWNQAEFASYLSSKGFQILEHKCVNDLKKTGLRKLVGNMGLDVPLASIGVIGTPYKSCQMVLAKLHG